MDPQLLEIIVSGDVNSLDALIASDPLILDQGEMVPSSDTPLHIAALVGKTELVEAIIAKKPNFVRQLNQAGFTPLHIASATGNLDIVKVLLSQSSDLCMLKDKDGRTPLHYAAIKGRTEIIEELLSRCPQALKERTAQRETALHLAMMNSQFDAVRLLLEKAGEGDADELIRAEDDVWNKVFQLAVATKQPQILDFLKSRNIINNGMWSKDSAILVVASLIATVTYEAGLSPPQTIWKNGAESYDRCFRHPFRQRSGCVPLPFIMFMVFNTTGFFSSVLLMIMFFRNPVQVRTQLFFAVASMVCTYMTLSISMAPGIIISTCIYGIGALALIYIIVAPLILSKLRRRTRESEMT